MRNPTSSWAAMSSGLVLLLAPAVTGAQQRLSSLRGDDDAALVADLRAAIPELIDKAHVPGLAVAVIRGGHVIWDSVFGVKDATTSEPVTSETLFEAASLTKPLFAYAAMQLVEDGVLELDTPLVDYLPREVVEEFVTHPLDVEGFRSDWLERVTARHVLSHSSGLPHGEPIDPHYPLFFAPGTRFKYSAAGFYLLQLTLEHRTGKQLEELAREHVFEPLDMTHSSMVWRGAFETKIAHGHGPLGIPQPFRKYERAHAAASMYTTAADYAQFVSAILNAKGLDAQHMKEMLTPQVEIDEHNSWSLGFGIQRDDNGDAFWQWGDYGIFRNFVMAYPEAKAAIVYLTNSYYGLSIGSDIVSRALGGAVHALEWLGYQRYDAPGVQLTWAVLEGGVQAALDQLPAMRADNPTAISENDVNRLGYAFLNAGRHEDAIGLFEHNVREHPTSANTYDSLAEAFMKRDAEGDIERAIENYGRALEAIPNDPQPDKEFLQRLRENAERQIRVLERRLIDRKGPE